MSAVICECGSPIEDCDRDHKAEEAEPGFVIYNDGTRTALCPVCHSTACEHEPGGD